MALDLQETVRPATVTSKWYEGTCDCCGVDIKLRLGYQPKSIDPYYCDSCTKELRKLSTAITAQDLKGATVVAIYLSPEGDDIHHLELETELGSTYPVALWRIYDDER